jgi:hypothetical protein
MRSIMFIFLTILVSGCAGSPARISVMSPTSLASEPTENLCGAYQLARQEKIKNEIVKRKEIPDEDWEIIDRASVKIGMSELSLICSMGNPSAVNRTVGAWGVSKQYIFRPCCNREVYYVYTENGVVTGFQD